MYAEPEYVTNEILQGMLGIIIDSERCGYDSKLLFLNAYQG